MRFDLLNYLFHFIGSQYAWGKEGPYKNGFDCSGLVLEGLRSIGKWGKDDATAQSIYLTFHKKYPKEVRNPMAGDLVFFGDSVSSITHIGIAINNYQFLEAGGGSKDTVDKGMVRIRPFSWRKDMVAVLDIFGDS